MANQGILDTFYVDRTGYTLDTMLYPEALSASSTTSFTSTTAELLSSSADLIANFNPWGISAQAILNLNSSPDWNTPQILPATITFTYGVPSEVILTNYVTDPEGDTFVLSKNAVSLPSGVTFDAANKKLVYNGFGNLNGETTAGHIFYANDAQTGVGVQDLSAVANITFLHQSPLQLIKLLNPGTSTSISWGTQRADIYSATGGGTLDSIDRQVTFTSTTASLQTQKTMSSSVSTAFTGDTADINKVVNLSVNSQMTFTYRASQSGGVDADDTPVGQVGIGSLGNNRLSKGGGLSKGSM